MAESCNLWVIIFVVAFLIIGGTTIVMFIIVMIRQMVVNSYDKSLERKVKQLQNELDECKNN